MNSAMADRSAGSRRWVIKVGSSLVTNNGLGLDRKVIVDWAAQIAELRVAGIDVVLVSSGAVAEGMARTGRRKRPDNLQALQATAAIGQMGLIQAYESAFAEHQLRSAQILLTHEDVRDRARYLNAQGAIRTLLDWGVVPIVNENDSVATEEIRLGDNDTLAALVCNLVEAQRLIILTDQKGLYTADPRTEPNAKLISEASLDDARLDAMAGEGRGDLGRGGMRTKLKAAHWAARSGAETVIVGGGQRGLLSRLAAGEQHGTLLRPAQAAMPAKKRWLAGQYRVAGKLVLDAGAVKVIRAKGSSLLPVGVTDLSGNFKRGDLVACVDAAGIEIARGLSQYDAADARLILGTSSQQLQERLGWPGVAELIHRDNLVVTG